MLRKNTMGRKCAIGTASVAVLLLVLGFALPNLSNLILTMELKKMLPLEKGSFSFDKWKNLPVPMLLQVWVLDVVNADEVMRNGAKPYVKEKGPYSYTLKKEKVNITFNGNGTVTYRQPTWYYFNRSLSVGEESDTFTTINNILVGAAFMTRFEYPIVQELLSLLIDDLEGELYQKYTVADMLWGYEDPLLKFVQKDILQPFNLTSKLDDHFGFFYKWNGSDDGLFTVFTGSEDIMRLNFVNRFNWLNEIPYWSTPYARMMNGTDGTFFPPFLDSSKRLYFVSSQACRTMFMEFEKENVVKEIQTYRYIMPDSMLADGNQNPDNAGFCTPDTSHCTPSGILNCTLCRDGSSAFMSYPHFLGATDEVIIGVDGLRPDPEQHRAHLDLEPISGVPMSVAMRLQIGVHVTNYSRISFWDELKKVFIEELTCAPIIPATTVIPDDLADQLRNEMILFIHVVDVLHILLPCLGAVMLLVSVIYLIRQRQLRKMAETSIPSETKPLIQ